VELPFFAVRATVAHDSYEQLVRCPCDLQIHRQTIAATQRLLPLRGSFAIRPRLALMPRNLDWL